MIFRFVGSIRYEHISAYPAANIEERSAEAWGRSVAKTMHASTALGTSEVRSHGAMAAESTGSDMMPVHRD